MPKDEKCTMFGCEKLINPDEEYLVVTHVKDGKLEQGTVCAACMGGAKMVKLILKRTDGMLKVEERVCL